MTELTREQQDILLMMARSSIENFVDGSDGREQAAATEELSQNGGAFVTLRIDGQLRGCTGYIRADKPLAHVIQEMAVSAASSDPRFRPLTKSELPNLTIGISVLSALKPVKRFEDIQVGVHGLLIHHDGRRGVLLPQVAAERDWDRETYLTNLCYKAGLPGDAWKMGAQLFSFTAVVFGVD